tara:strand:+ start:273 stop:479 length:207 start_codon:yes stop_codon:yes gene_type:complete
MITGNEFLRKVQSLDLTKREQKPVGYYMDLVEKENQQYRYEEKLSKQRRLGLPIQGPLTSKQFNRNNS